MLLIYLYFLCNLPFILGKAKRDRKKLNLDPVDKRISYSGYKAIEATAETSLHIEWLSRFRRYDVDFDFWKFPTQPKDKFVFMAEGQKLESIYDLFDSIDLKKRKVYLKDVQKDSLDLQEERFRKRRIDKDFPLRFMIEEYHPYQMMEDELAKLATKRCPKDIGIFCETYSIGKTVEGRDIKVFKVHKGQTERKSYFVISGTHGREWFSTALSVTFVYQFLDWLNEPEFYPNIQTLMEDGDWHFLFIANPDSYAYTWTDDRLWNKNKGSNDGHLQCKGVDLDANFDYNWEESEGSNNFCSRYYKGPKPASEPETQAIQKELKRLAPSLRAVIRLGDMGPSWNFPWPAGQNLENMDVDTKRAYDLCRLAAVNGSDTIGITLGMYVNDSCKPSEVPPGGDLLGYARHVAGVKNVWEFKTADNNEGYSRTPIDLNAVSHQLLAGVVVKVYTLRNETFPEFLVHDFSGGVGDLSDHDEL